jgi:hypothetical protein
MRGLSERRSVVEVEESSKQEKSQIMRIISLIPRNIKYRSRRASDELWMEIKEVDRWVFFFSSSLHSSAVRLSSNGIEMKRYFQWKKLQIHYCLRAGIEKAIGQQSRLTRTRKREPKHKVRVNSWISGAVELSPWLNKCSFYPISFLLSPMNVSIDFSNDLSYLLSKHCSAPLVCAIAKRREVERMKFPSCLLLHELIDEKRDCTKV